jgi:hypothetical protein
MARTRSSLATPSDSVNSHTPPEDPVVTVSANYPVELVEPFNEVISSTGAVPPPDEVKVALTLKAGVELYHLI